MFSSFLRPVAALAALSGLAAYATIMLRGPQGLSALAEKHREIRLLQEQNARLQYEIELKKLRIERLTNDPTAQKVELERIGMVGRNDTVFKERDKSIVAPATPGPNSASK